MTLGERLTLVALALVVFLPGIASRDLWNPDEPRYAEVAREMRLDGHWLVPHLNGRVYSEKPPLQFWSIAGASYLTSGVGPVAARIPAVGAVIATALLLAGIAVRLFDRRVAWWSAIIFLSSTKVLWQGRIGQIDMLLTALVAAAMYCFVRGLVEERPGFYRGFFLFAGLATLAKGPVGLLPPLLAIGVWALVAGERRVLADLRIPSGLLLWAAIVLLWLVPAGIDGGRSYLETIVFKQNVRRYVDPWHHFKPWYYYLAALPWDFFPWSFLLPGAVWIGWRRIFGEARRGVLLALSWMLVTLTFFSASPAKRDVYILPMYPAMALLVAAALSEIESTWPRLRHWLTVPVGLAAATAAIATLGGFVAVRFFPERLAEPLAELAPMGPGILAMLLAIGIVLAAVLQAGWLFARRGRVWRTVQSLAGAMALVAITASVALLPRFDVIKSAKPLAEILVAKAAPEEPWAIWPRLDPTFVFHTRRYAVELDSVEELRAFASRPERVWLLISKPELAKLGASLRLVEIARDTEVGNGYVLMSNGGPASG